MNNDKLVNKILRILDFFYLLRPTLFFPGITIYLFGINDSEGSFSLIPFLIILFLLSITYLTNQIFDIKTDTINNKLYFLTRNIISLKIAKIYNIVLYIFMILFAILFYTVSYIPFLVILLLLFIVIVVFYNFNFFNWKAKPFFSIFSSFLGGLLFYLVGYYSNLEDLEILNIKYFLQSILSSLPFALAVLSVSIMTMITDIAGDKNSDKKTFAVYFRNKKSNYAIMIISIINIVLSYLISNNVVFYISIVSIILSLMFHLRNYEMKYLLYNIKISVLLLSLAIGYEYPLYLIIITIYFFITRIYYKKRFNVIYP